MAWKNVAVFVFYHGKSKLSGLFKDLNVSQIDDAIAQKKNNSFFSRRNNAFKEDEGAWKGEGDGKVVNDQPQRVMMDGQQMMASGYIGK